jgi:hypothetical protein
MKKFNLIQKLALLYAFLFLFVISLNFIPQIHDADGYMFGLFKLDLIDDLLHLASGLWALGAGLHSFAQSRIYFRIFGVFYFLDGIICTIFEKCILDFTIFTHVHEISYLSNSNIIERLLINGPHLMLGGIAIYIGFSLSKKFTNEK